jgi:RNA polymerase sigma-70 factor (ECF subfamily)
MLSYQSYWAAKGHLLALAGDAALATEALTVAVGLTTDDAVKGYLLRRLASLKAN